MSALEPWAMTWGKLAGAPAFAWYGCGFCLVAYLFVSPDVSAPKIALFMLAGMVLMAAVSLIGSIVAGRKAVARRSSTAWVMGVALVFVGPWMSALTVSDAWQLAANSFEASFADAAHKQRWRTQLDQVFAAG